MSAVNPNTKYLEFLKNHEEDLSSLFCSELVAHVYQEVNLIGELTIVTMKHTSTSIFVDKTKLSDEFTPDDFSSHRTLKLNFGYLESEIYIEIKQ